MAQIAEAAAKAAAAKDKDPTRHWTERVADPDNARNFADEMKRIIDEE